MAETKKMPEVITNRLAPISTIQLSLAGPQSVTDYPLRNQTMLAVCAFAVLLLARVAVDPRERRA
ncbi:MAG: hypothetical protein ACXIT4_04440 [Erythrobacter sp.]